ncbi:phenylacetate-CoA oxygenase subunit PaaC [Schinkia azotoformans]|uniref:Phenylacetate-CoA oxygenase subunit PaaI n=1 Tax=Schinkia azotoformans LMG 9581 TaxID=1131731 RepID=K6D661_SCHAZ|nr:1,2-phenylacetyl-CoA epoxidase subunit PaaC [Schinkia azotoformans]EKN63523.1 phenylacetate-CoA oxygenase subunit PaaI [Schinkia azotoformans LMG 9581]MEC1638823.1 phenylacetate-CoA oxygenase subunit PaaC [Schinkia azotoformans]MEC1946788.1 phenylacetate-CoA oxygenase subunit PaaC [Schinkia azotoformans]MED4353199.1 phenylacetate-CoA oxygenase subunit PaaC [Schinkia azotoformans]
MKITSANEVNDPKNVEYKKVLVDLLYQLADDDFLHSFRGSEWLGLVPHIEEDVAYSSIAQNTMGHAAIYYELLEEIGEGKSDDLAHGRSDAVRKNAILLEEVNGPGGWLYEEPKYDWAFTVVRNYFYEVMKKHKIESLKTSSYEPLAQVAIKVQSETIYHLMHWRTWFYQLVSAEGEARDRMKAAIEKAWRDVGGLLSLGPNREAMVNTGLIDGEEVLKERFVAVVKDAFEHLNLEYPGEPGMERGDGRTGVHTADLKEAINTLAEVYNLNPAVSW